MPGAEPRGRAVQDGAETDDEDTDRDEINQRRVLQSDGLSNHDALDHEHRGHEEVLDRRAQGHRPGWPIRGDLEHVARFIARPSRKGGKRRSTRRGLGRLTRVSPVA